MVLKCAESVSNGKPHHSSFSELYTHCCLFVKEFVSGGVYILIRDLKFKATERSKGTSVHLFITHLWSTPQC